MQVIMMQDLVRGVDIGLLQPQKLYEPQWINVPLLYWKKMESRVET